MKASFRITNPRMLAEAQAGDLFVPLGPDLVECVCAVRCIDGADGIRADMPTAARFDPDAALTVVVVACRVGRGEPEYYPPGYCTALSGAAPVAFLQQCEALQLQPRIERADTATNAAATAHADPLYADLDAMQSDMDRLNLVDRQHLEALRELHRKHRVALSGAIGRVDLARPELASKL